MHAAENAALPLVTLLALVWLHVEQQPAEKIANHAWYTFWYVVPTLPMFLAFPWMLGRWGFWGALGAAAVLTVLCFVLTAWASASGRLAQWVALALREDWSVETRRRLIANVVPLYRLRGTTKGIELALAAYRAQDFTKAEAGFLACRELAPEDGPTKLFLERVLKLRASPPAADWNGVWHWESK